MKRILTKEQSKQLRGTCAEIRTQHPDWKLIDVLREALKAHGMENLIKINTSAARRYVGMKNGQTPRKYKPRRKKPEPIEPPASQPVIRYCPHCGFPLGVHIVAYRTAQRMRGEE